MPTIQENTDKLEHFIYQKFVSDQLDNNSLVQIIKACGKLLNLQTLPQWAAENGKTYNGAKLQSNQIEIFNTKFIIDNE